MDPFVNTPASAWRARTFVAWALSLAAFACTLADEPAGSAPPSVGAGGADTAGSNGTSVAGSSSSSSISTGASSSMATGATTTTSGTGGAATVGTGGSAGSGESPDAVATTDGSGGAKIDAAEGGTKDGPSAGSDTPPLRPLMVDTSKSCKCELKFSAKSLDMTAGTSGNDTHAGDQQSMRVDTTKKMVGKLVIVLGGINGGPGPGGIYGYAIGKGFHGFLVATQTSVSGAPATYKDALKANPNDPEANRQVGDARMEAWDGVDRVSWLDVKTPDSIVRRTELALKHAQDADPGGDWAYYLNADGTVRWSDVYMVGYSFGSQTIAMVSKYVRFGRVLTTSGPQDEGFPNAAWIKQASATPVERLYMMVGGMADYPPASGDVGNKIDTVKAAGWLGDPLNVHAGAAGPFGSAHILVLVGQGHSEMCAGDGGMWKAICDYGFGLVP